MTSIEAYDACATAWDGRAGVWRLGDEHIIGRWVAPTEDVRTVLRSRSCALEVIGSGPTWEAALKHAGFTP